MDKARRDAIRVELDLIHTKRMRLLKEFENAGPFEIKCLSSELERLGMRSDDLVHELTRNSLGM